MNSTNNYISPEDFTRILDTIPELGIRKWQDKDIQMLFKILYWCGLRFNEGIHIQYEDIDLEREEIQLHKTKTEKNAIAVIPPQFLDELVDWLADKDPGRLFPGLSYDTGLVWIKRLGKMLNIKAWTTPQSETGEKTKLHIFRKSIGKDMLYGTHTKKKAPLSVISTKLRHKDFSVTMRYLKVGHEEEKDYWYEDRDEERP